MEILGLDPILLAIIITAIGVVASVALGWLKGNESFNLRHAIASAFIAFVFSVQLVSAELNLITPELDGLVITGVLFGLIAQVAGIDSLAKSGMKAALKTRIKAPKPE